MKKCAYLWCLVVPFLVVNAWADPINVDIYGDFKDTGGGVPYWNYVGSFSSPDVMFATNTEYNWHPYGLSRFGADITGFLQVVTTNSYTFTLHSDDGSVLYIDGNLAVYNGDPHGPTAASDTVSLSEGIHEFEIQFFEDFGGESGVDLYLPEGVDYVPEPATLMLLGLGGMILRNRKS
jgi:hypothetical protein